MKRMCLFIFLISCFLKLSANSFAKPVDKENSVKATKTFLKIEQLRQEKKADKLAKEGKKILESIQKHKCDNTTPIYGEDNQVLAWVTELQPEGFIITSADDMIRPIVGYSFKGKFPFKDSKQNILLHLVQWDVEARLKALSSITPEVEVVTQSNTNSWEMYTLDSNEYVQTTESTTTQWGPLISTQWDQGGHFDDQCPLRTVGGTDRCAVGCVATSIAQIVNYWKYPGSIQFSSLPWYLGGDSYTSKGTAGNIDIDGDAADRDFPTFAQLNSALSTVNYNGNPDEEAYLCFAAGIKVRMKYGSQSSAGLSGGAYRNGFDYGSASWRFWPWGLWSTYESTVIENIKNGWPVQIGIQKSDSKGGHSVIVDGYKTTGDYHFWVNYGWGGTNDMWYNPPDIQNYNLVTQIVFNICPYQGWNQYGGNQYNNFKTIYTIPDKAPIREKWRGTTSTGCSGMIVGTNNNIYITKSPLIINDPAYRPALVIINHYGEKLDEIEIPQINWNTISHPVQSPDGNVYVGSGNGIYRIIPRSRVVQKIYYDSGSDTYGDQTPRLDESGRMYFGSETTLICFSSTGSVLWRWNCPSGGVMYTGIPSVDTGRDNVYMSYWKSSMQTAHLACINRLTGITRYEQSFSNIPTADRGIHTPAIGSNGTVYTSVRTKIYALIPGTSSFSQKWMQDKLYARFQPISLGPDDTVYTEYWTQTGGNYYVTFAALNPVNGSVKWEVKKPDVGTYTSFGQPSCGSNGVVIFPVKWDTSPNETFELFAYRDNGSSAQFLWNYIIENDPGCSLAMGPGATVYLYRNKKIVALSNGDVGDPDGGGMCYTNNIRPDLPSSPIPADEANNIDLTVMLSWTCSDPEDNPLKYSLFVGESGYDMVPVATDLSSPSYTLTELESSTGYAWKVIATDGQAVSEGPTWVFSTKANPDIDGDGKTNLSDFSVIAKHWLELDCSDPNWCEGADINKSGKVDPNDLSILAEHWLEGTSLTPNDMVLIPGGTIQMGDGFNEGSSDECPVHTVTLSSFYMSRYEITNNQYCQYLNSALNQGFITVISDVVYKADFGTSYPYCDTYASSSYSQIDYSGGVFTVRTKGGRNMSNDPMVCVSWYGAVAYCNWRSQQEGKQPCYNLSTWTCDFSKKGYRLPTEAQWEYAARGGLSGRRFPWGDTITHSQANYYSNSYYSYDISPTREYHPTWNNGIMPYTSPTGSFSANGFGLFDMAGNVWEWCNDWYLSTYYSSSPLNNPTGPSSGSYRVLRGGYWGSYAYYCRVAYRSHYDDPDDPHAYYGFRISMDF